MLSSRADVIFACITFLGTFPASKGQSGSPNFIVEPKDETWDISLSWRYLLCAADGLPSIKWFKDGSPLAVSDGDRRISISNDIRARVKYSKLTFASLVKTDEGRYMCVASNRLGSVRSSENQLTIFGPPIVNPDSPPPSTISVAWDGEFSIPCIGKGPPTVTSLKWDYKAYSNRKSGPKVQGRITGSTGYPYLTTLPNKQNARRLKVVEYDVFCTVRNDKGFATSTTTKIYILHSPDPPIIIKVSAADKLVVVTYKLTYSKSKPIDFCSLQLQKADSNLSPELYRLEVAPSGSGNEKIVSNLQPSTSYSIKARCQNQIGLSDWTSVTNFATEDSSPERAPSNVTVTPVNQTAVFVAWSPIQKEYANGKITGYGVKVIHADQPTEQEVYRVGANTNVFVAGKVLPGEKYWIRVNGFNKKGESPWSDIVAVTMPRYPQPDPPVIENILVNSQVVIIRFSTKPGLGTAKCNIRVKNGHGIFSNSVEIAKNITEYTMSGLPANAEYAATIMCETSHGTSDWSIPVLFKTPEGKPDKAPGSISLKETAEHNLLASWEPYNPDDLNGFFAGYNICITPAVASSKTKCFDSIGAENYKFTNISPQTAYTVFVSTCTKAGCGPFSNPPEIIHTSSWIVTTGVTTSAITTPAHDERTVQPQKLVSSIVLYALIIGCVVLAICIGLGVFICRHKKKKHQNANGNSAMYIPGEPSVTLEYDQVPSEITMRSHRSADTLNPYYTPLLANSSMLSNETMEKLKGVELRRDRLKICKVLGEGEFGCVYKGLLLPRSSNGSQRNIDIAIKTMKMNEFDASEREEFVKEGLRMKNLDHSNVMQLVGICLPESGMNTNGINQIRLSGYEAVSPLVVIPYMEHGDLRSHLYLARTTNDTDHLTLNKLLGFASDIAKGMEYLSSKNIVHRDLACRNCMLDSKMNVVVSDFGLSRQIYSSNYYRQRRVAKMPVKWMALESLRDRIYTHQTDVWSFGVTAWEVFTFCQNPYPGVANHEMHDLLKAGTRLKHPPKCPKDVWDDAIYPCWDPRPEERPHFSELVVMMENFLQAYPEGYSLELSTAAPGYVNVMPPEYEQLTSTSSSKENNKELVTYDVAVVDRALEDTREKKPPLFKANNNKISSKRPLLQTESQNGDESDDGGVINL